MKTYMPLIAVWLFLSSCGVGEALLTVADHDDAFEEFDENSTVSSELSAARPLLSQGLGIVSRESWGARPAGTCRAAQTPNRVIIHHVGGNVSNPLQWLKSHDTELRVNRGWCDLMYHFGVDEQGVIYEMTATGVRGAHAPEANPNSVAILIMGNYQTREPTAAQAASVQKLLKALKNTYGLVLDRSKVLGHRQVGATACPGNLAYPKLDAWVAAAAASPATGAQPVSWAAPAFSAVASGLKLTSAAPRRFLDTRNTTKLIANTARSLGNASSFGGATAVSLGVALVAPEADAFVTVYPGSAVPGTSTVNAKAGEVRANQTLVPTAGGVNVRAVANTHVVVDEQARFGATGFGFHALASPRALDTRSGAPLAAGTVREVSLTGVGVPTTAAAAQLGFAVIPRGAPGHIAVVPCGTSTVTTSAVNFNGSNVASGAAVAPVKNGRVCIISSTAADLVIDVAGYYGFGGAALTLNAPVRVLDTRDGKGGWKGLPDANQVLRIDVSKLSGWPSGVKAAAFSLTSVAPGAAGFARVWSCDGTPTHSNVNNITGKVVATFGVVRATNALCVSTTTPQHLVVDLVGVYR